MGIRRATGAVSSDRRTRTRSHPAGRRGSGRAADDSAPGCAI